MNESTNRTNVTARASAFRSGLCPHLGLRGKPFETDSQPSKNNRCYVWASDRVVSLPHQQSFCLTERHDTCPFLVRMLGEDRRVGRRSSQRSSSPLTRTLKKASRQIGDWLVEEFRGEGETLAAIVPASLKPETAADRARAIVDLESTLYRIDGFVPGQASFTADTRSDGVLFPVDEPTVDQLLQAGLAAARAGSYDEARETFDEALRRDAQCDEAYLWRAVTIIDQEGRREFLNRDATPVDRELVDEWLIREGISAYGKRNRGWAQRCFAAATELSPTNPRGWYWQAKAASTFDDAIATLERYVDANPNDQEALAYLGHVRRVHLQQPGRLTDRISDRIDRLGDWLLYRTWIPARTFAILTAIACLASSLLWLVPVLAVAGGLPMAEAESMQIAWLPSFGLPTLLVFLDGVQRAAVDLNLWVPSAIGLSQIWLSLSIGERLAMRARWTLLILAGGFLGAIGAVSNVDAQVVLITLNVVAMLGILLAVRERMNSRFGWRQSPGAVTSQATRGLF